VDGDDVDAEAAEEEEGAGNVDKVLSFFHFFPSFHSNIHDSDAKLVTYVEQHCNVSSPKNLHPGEI
jgi:hypothetical protein